MAACAPRVPETIDQLKKLYFTTSGYSQDEVDRAGYTLFDNAREEVAGFVSNLISDLPSEKIQIKIQSTEASYAVNKPAYRCPASHGGRLLQVITSSAAPAQASIIKTFCLAVPLDCGIEDDIIIYDQQTSDILFDAWIAEILPNLSVALQMRLRVWAEGVVARVLQDLRAQAAKALRGSGG